MKKFLLGLTLVLGLFSCSNDSDDISDIQYDYPLSVTVIGNFDEDVTQLDINRDGTVTQQVNLKEELQLPDNVFTKVDGKIVSFYDNWPSPGLWQVNVETGDMVTKSPFCSSQDVEFIQFFAISERFDVAIASNNTSNELGDTVHANIFDTHTNTCTSMSLGNAIDGEAIIQGDKMIVLRENNNGESILFIDLPTATIYHEIPYEERHFSATIIDDELFITSAGMYERYALSTGDFLGTKPLDYFLSGGLQLFESDASNGEMVYFQLFAQPFPLVGGPAIYNYESNTQVAGGNFIYDVYLTLQSEFLNVEITSYQVDIVTRQVVLGFAYMEGQSVDFNKGGVAFTNFEGENLVFYTMDIVPQLLIIRD